MSWRAVVLALLLAVLAAPAATATHDSEQCRADPQPPSDPNPVDAVVYAVLVTQDSACEFAVDSPHLVLILAGGAIGLATTAVNAVCDFATGDECL